MHEYRCPCCQTNDQLFASFVFAARLKEDASPDMENVITPSKLPVMDEFTYMQCRRCGREGELIEFMSGE